MECKGGLAICKVDWSSGCTEWTPLSFFGGIHFVIEKFGQPDKMESPGRATQRDSESCL